MLTEGFKTTQHPIINLINYYYETDTYRTHWNCSNEP